MRKAIRKLAPASNLDPVLMAKAALLKRQSEDPLNHYKASPNQSLFHHRTQRYVLVNAPTRSGKTTCNAMDLSMVARRRHPTKTVTCVNGIYMVFGTSREALRDNWYGKLRVTSKLRGPAENSPMIPDWEILDEKFSGGGGDRTIREIVMRHPDNPNLPGHRILFGLSGDSRTWRRMEGKDRVLGIYFDEVEGSAQLFTECFRRLIETHSHPEIKSQANGGFIAWSGTETKENEVFKEWMEKCDKPEEFPEYARFKLTPDETGAISNEERAKMAQNMNKQDYEISMLGVGRFSDRLLIYGQQLDPKRHLLENDYVPTPDDNLWVGYDPGFDHNSGMLVAAINPRNPFKLHIVKAWSHPKTTLGQDIALLRMWLRGRFIECFVADPASHKTEKGLGKKLITMIREELMRAGIKSLRGFRMPYNRHEPGIFAVRRYLDPVPGNRNAEPLIVFNASKPSGCLVTWNQMCNYRSHKENEYQGTHGVIKKNDDGVDVIRYLVNCTDRSPWNSGGAPNIMRPTWVKRAPNIPTWEEAGGMPSDAYAVTQVTEVTLTDDEMLAKDRERKSALAAKIRSRGGRRFKEGRRLALEVGPEDD